jgi:hypothetical protein
MVLSDFHMPPNARYAGYAELSRRVGLKVRPNWHESVIVGATHRVHESAGHVWELYPARMWPGDSVADHLEFALRHDGVNLLILAKVFENIDVAEFTNHIQKKPLGMNNRRLWYLYEFITGKRLDLPDLAYGKYIDLLDQEKYFASWGVRKSSRHRVSDNLLGVEQFCPIVRLTPTIKRYEEIDFKAQCQKVISVYPPEFLLRALSYLYTKETKSSFEIEHIQPDSSRMERFIALLRLAEKDDYFCKPPLIELQNRIVDPRFSATNFRQVQNYIGETLFPGRERVHYVCPKPENIGGLMDGLFVTVTRVAHDEIHPIVQAAIVAFGFVFLRPFEDGNGRIHRFLIHNILAIRGFTPRGLMFPISATLLNNKIDYDAALEDFSKSIAPCVDYQLDDLGRMTVQNDTRDLYRFMDLTRQAEFLFEMIEKTVVTELPRELAMLASYDRVRTSLQEIVDLPDRKMDLFIRLCIQNNGKISPNKREEHFSMLTDNEVEKMENAFAEAWKTPRESS